MLMTKPYILDCAGQKVSPGDTFSYATRRGSNLSVNLYQLDSIEGDVVKATISGGPMYEWRTKRQSTIGCFSERATLVGPSKWLTGGSAACEST